MDNFSAELHLPITRDNHRTLVWDQTDEDTPLQLSEVFTLVEGEPQLHVMSFTREDTEALYHFLGCALRLPK